MIEGTEKSMKTCRFQCMHSHFTAHPKRSHKKPDRRNTYNFTPLLPYYKSLALSDVPLCRHVASYVLANEVKGNCFVPRAPCTVGHRRRKGRLRLVSDLPCHTDAES